MEEEKHVLKKLVLASIGAAVTSAEKAGELVTEWVSKGELSVSQGKEMTAELKKRVFPHEMENLGAEQVNKFKDQMGDVYNELNIATHSQLQQIQSRLSAVEIKLGLLRDHSDQQTHTEVNHGVVVEPTVLKQDFVQTQHADSDKEPDNEGTKNTAEFAASVQYNGDSKKSVEIKTAHNQPSNLHGPNHNASYRDKKK